MDFMKPNEWVDSKTLCRYTFGDIRAGVVKLVDTHVSGACGSDPMRVQISPPALIFQKKINAPMIVL